VSEVDERPVTTTVELEAGGDDLLGLAEVSVEEATSSADCRVPGCTREANWTRGYYAYLCQEHAAERRDGRRAQAELRVRGSQVGVAETDGGPGETVRVRVEPEDTAASPVSLQDAVRALVAPAGRLERASEKRRLARGEALAAVEEFNDALRAVRELAQRLIG